MLRFADLRVSDVMTSNPARLHTTTPAGEALQRLRSWGFWEGPVVGGDGALLGMISQGELAEGLLAAAPEEREAADARPVGGLVVRHAVTCAPALDLADACALMIRSKARHLIVVEAGQPLGAISPIDVVRTIACLKDFEGQDLPSPLPIHEVIPPTSPEGSSSKGV